MEEINLSCNKIIDTPFINNKYMSFSNNVNNINLSVYDLLNTKLSNDYQEKFNKYEIENIVLNIMNSSCKKYDKNLFKNIVIKTINNTHIKKIDLSFNKINNISPLFKHVNKINLYVKQNIDEPYHQYKLKNYLQKYFNINSLNKEFLERINKLSTEIILIWGNPGIIGDFI